MLDVQWRNTQFAEKLTTQITDEVASKDNPFINEDRFTHGYNNIDLIGHCSFSELIFLLFKGDLPDQPTLAAFDRLFVALANPGLRHPACRAATVAAASGTMPGDLLPIGLLMASGEFLGATEIEQAARFIRDQLARPAAQVAEEYLQKATDSDDRVAPGFGTMYGSVDLHTQKLAIALNDEHGGHHMQWSGEFVSYITPQAGWLVPAVAAAGLLDLGFVPKACGAIYQLIIAPSVLAHSMESVGKSWDSLPWIDNKHYHIKGATNANE